MSLDVARSRGACGKLVGGFGGVGRGSGCLDSSRRILVEGGSGGAGGRLSPEVVVGSLTLPSFMSWSLSLDGFVNVGGVVGELVGGNGGSAGGSGVLVEERMV